jgi:hypothetical protein
MKYDIDHFIKKFEAIPKERWLTGHLGAGEQHCALGHCGGYYTVESMALRHIAEEECGMKTILPYITIVNDSAREFGTHPKERVLNFLKMIKEKEESGDKAVQEVEQILSQSLELA